MPHPLEYARSLAAHRPFRGRLLYSSPDRVVAFDYLEPWRISFATVARRVVVFAFRPHLDTLGHVVDGPRSDCLLRLRSRAIHTLAGPPCTAKRRSRTLCNRHRLANLDRRISFALLQPQRATPAPYEPGPLSLRAPSAVCVGDRWEGSDGLDFRELLCLAAGGCLGAAFVE